MTSVLGVVLGVPTATVAVPLESAVANLSAGQEIVGAGVFTTVTVKLQDAPAPDETLTVVVPTGNNEPEAGEADIAPQSPLRFIADAKLTTAPLELVAVATIFAGQSKVQLVPVAPTTVATSDVVLLKVF